MKKTLVLLIIVLSPKFFLGQELSFTDTSLINYSKLTILSEWHLEDILPTYKRTLIEKIYKEEGITDLILETGNAAAYLLNDYLATGDTAILDNFVLFKQRDKEYWKEFRKYKLPSGENIKIHGVDFERMTIVPALKRVLMKTGNTKNELFNYLNSLPDTIMNLGKYDMMIAERSAIIQKCISIYNSNIKYYSTIPVVHLG